ncbi:DEAD/DEAH box helicase family protein [Leptospira paudalimensis]|uniref:DEAD/DEAH box helicase family protein n=1 Tax=Leptospira paudalimensis TaxID=2950024 RepID=A0ABT3MCM0_9LEPT|nr:DEAD/DEAH box helicase family protein [Leptospira paudalimensis]MCW7506122.1 DEAD/DEAH box helicase family protein [Leptospira paudalimensis]
MPKANANTIDKNQAELLKESKPNPFGKKLVLVHFLYSFFGAKDFRDLTKGMRDQYEVGNEDTIGERVIKILQERLLQTAPFDLDDLVGYANRIDQYTLEISAKRDHFEGWKYFQYLSLVFTEIYLDLYMKNLSDLKRRLNEFLDQFQKDFNNKDRLNPFQFEDLNVLAFWNATGSGKTLLMHIHIKQYLYYHKKYEKKDIINIMLLTPNEGLSKQHLEEFHLSGMSADFFQIEGSQGDLYKERIKILDIYKLDEVKGVKTIAVESLEGKNLILVDEGHRGSSGETWMKFRKQLAKDGFSFEYSATFGQIISRKAEHYQQYAKCILFDYSYKYFHEDGFGKEFHILNLQDAKFNEKKNTYLVACLLTFLEQKLFFKASESELEPFHIENPLMVLVGSTVIGSKTKGAEDTVSDVADLIHFLNWFLKNPKQAQKDIALVLEGKAGLVDNLGQDIFSSKFIFLRSLKNSSEEVYKSILETVFHTRLEKSQIHLVELKHSSGEIGLKVGASDFFGVINIGDVPTFMDLCEGKSLIVEKEEFGVSLFHNINSHTSSINVLIGSKKFTEGWNSWRVSCMGLLNIGRNEGAQIIQLFGRGVRLRGYNHSLKRSRFLHDLPDSLTVPEHILIGETLNIFGIHANYIQKFQEYIEEEGVVEDSKKQVITVPVKKLEGIQDLKILDLKKGTNFSKTEILVLKSPDTKFSEALQKRPIVLNWYTKIQGFASEYLDRNQKQTVYEKHHFQEWHLSFLNLNQLYFNLVEFKKNRGFHNLLIQKHSIKEILLNRDWYVLEIPEKEFSLSAENKEITWQEIALSLLQKYISRFYYFQKDDFESDKREYIKIEEYEKRKIKSGSKGNLFNEYKISINQSDVDLISYFEDLKKELEKTNFSNGSRFTPESPKIIPILLDQHLYKPILFQNQEVLVHVSPSSIIAKSELTFLEAFSSFTKNNANWFSGINVYLLRNLSRHGISLFDVANFYPDFILWIKNGKDQKIAFIDPKGLIEIPFGDAKIEFFKKVKETEERIGDKSVKLTSFIATPTKFNDLRPDKGYAGKSKAELENHNILFMEDDKSNDLFIHKLFHRILGDLIPKPTESVQIDLLPKLPDIKRLFRDVLPVYSIQAACGKFGDNQEIEDPIGYIEVSDRKLDDQMFVIKATGESMVPTISPDDYLIFRANPSGSRNGKIVLVELLSNTEPETQAKYIIKEYSSQKGTDGHNTEIILKSRNQNFSPITIKSSEGEVNQIKVIAEFISVLK